MMVFPFIDTSSQQRTKYPFLCFRNHFLGIFKYSKKIIMVTNISRNKTPLLLNFYLWYASVNVSDIVSITIAF